MQALKVIPRLFQSLDIETVSLIRRHRKRRQILNELWMHWVGFTTERTVSLHLTQCSKLKWGVRSALKISMWSWRTYSSRSFSSRRIKETYTSPNCPRQWHNCQIKQWSTTNHGVNLRNSLWHLILRSQPGSKTWEDKTNRKSRNSS